MPLTHQSRILIIDDEPGIIDLLSYALSNEGLQVVAVSNVEDGLAEFRQLAYHLVITDIFMSGMGGIEGIRAMRFVRPDIKILAISGGYSEMTPEDALLAASKLGADAALAKPFLMPDLLDTVRQLLEG